MEEDLKMTKRDFELIARVIADERNRVHDYSHPESADGALRAIAISFAAELARVNPRFDLERFMRACGFGKG